MSYSVKITRDSIFGPTGDGVPNPFVSVLNQYPTRFHGANFVVPDQRRRAFRENPRDVPIRLALGVSPDGLGASAADAVLFPQYDLQPGSGAVKELKRALKDLASARMSPTARPQANETTWQNIGTDDDWWGPDEADEFLAFVARCAFAYTSVLDWAASGTDSLELMRAPSSLLWQYLAPGGALPGNDFDTGPQPTLLGVNRVYWVYAGVFGESAAMSTMPKFRAWIETAARLSGQAVTPRMVSALSLTATTCDGQAHASNLTSVCPSPGPGFQQRILSGMYAMWTGLANSAAEPLITGYMSSLRSMRDELVTQISQKTCAPSNTDEDACLLRNGYEWKADTQTCAYTPKAPPQLPPPCVGVCSGGQVWNATKCSCEAPKSAPASTAVYAVAGVGLALAAYWLMKRMEKKS